MSIQLALLSLIVAVLSHPPAALSPFCPNCGEDFKTVLLSEPECWNDLFLGGPWRLASAIAKTSLHLQPDSNMVLYDGSGKAMWSTETIGTGANHLVLQGDGNLVFYRPDGKPMWSSRTEDCGTGPYCLRLLDEGPLILYDTYCKVIWMNGVNLFRSLELNSTTNGTA
ncbi:Aste57867_19693 [Aphanomyces stellatus]|uniref:Aste57867_19693 protein n=1 Tax=Aphanomyces stellatus TaxID=120398 RepID=A0A485LD63_9STRA|nr:hypothetical protein As57867_019628 [Aphanomyces stellatus]VFT96393.1 Aste57867_19693 [Aphanomyces stellatus]